MTLKLVAPGRRKNNRHYVIVGWFLGRYIERSTHTYDELEAIRAKARLELSLIDTLIQDEYRKRRAEGPWPPPPPWGKPIAVPLPRRRPKRDEPA